MFGQTKACHTVMPPEREMALAFSWAPTIAWVLLAAAVGAIPLSPCSADPSYPALGARSAAQSSFAALPAGVSNIHFPLAPSTVAAVPGLRLGMPPVVQNQPRAAVPALGQIRPALSGNDYSTCDATADAPPQEIVDLARALQGHAGANGWINIFQYVHNQIDLEPTAESSKGAFGTYLDRSGSSFDQASLLVALLRSAGYTAQYVVGTATLTAGQVGLSSLPQQLIRDGGGNANGTMPYAWVQISLNGTWQPLDPANKSYTIYLGANFSSTLGSGVSGSSAQIAGALSAAAQAIYNGPNAATQNYASVTSFVGGSRLVSSFSTSNFGTIGTGGTAYQSLPMSVRVGFTVGPVGGGTPSSNFCLDQIYGHNVSYVSNSHVGNFLQIDNLLLPQSFPDTAQLTISHPGMAGWTQYVFENLLGTYGALAFQVGRTSQFRATHDANVFNAASNSSNLVGTSTALTAAASSELSQTSRTTALLDQLAGTYTVVHHILQIIRTNNTVDTPMTSTSVDTVNASPASGLHVSAQAVPYALSALQSAQEAIALQQAGATQPVSAAGLLGAIATPGGTQFIPHNGSTTVDPNYSASQVQLLDNYLGLGYDLVIPASAPGASAPLGFMAINGAGTSAFVLDTTSGVYKGAADLNPTSGLGALGMGGTAAEAGPAASGLSIDGSSGEVTYATPLISVGSAAPYKLEFDLLYSSRPDAQLVTRSPVPANRNEAAGFANNFEMQTVQSSDGFSLVGSDLGGGAIVGAVAAYDLLQAGNTVASYYAGQGSSPADAAYASAAIANWISAQGTNNVVTVQQGLSNTVFVKMPDGQFHTPQPSAATLTGSFGSFVMRTPQGTKYNFAEARGKVSSIVTPAGVTTSFSYTSNPNGSLLTVSVGIHSLTLFYLNVAATGTSLLWSVTDENSRQANLKYTGCNNSNIVTTIPQLCAGTRPDIGPNAPASSWPVVFGYGQATTGPSNQTAVLLKDVSILSPAPQTGYSNTTIAYDGARMMPTTLTNANSHTTTYYTAPGRAEQLDAVGNDSYSVTYPSQFGRELLITDSYDPLGYQTELQYNYAGQLVYKTLPDTQNGGGTVYLYDSRGNLASTSTGPANARITTTTTWDPTWNKPATIVDPLNHQTTYTYSSNNGDLRDVVLPTVNYLGNATQPIERYVFNTNGQLHLVSAADGEITLYQYDTNFNLTTITVDQGAPPRLNLVTSIGYDSEGNVRSVTNARGNTTYLYYDDARRLVKTISPPVDGQYYHDANYTYDTVGRLTETDLAAFSAGPTVTLTTKVAYDAVGNVISRTLPTTGATDITTTYTYDADERLSLTKVPRSATFTDITQNNYDADSRLHQVLLNNQLTKTMTYNGDGLPYQVGDGSATVNADGTLGGSAHIITYTYDPYDRLTSTAYADGTSELLTLDNAGRVTRRVNRADLFTNYVYDALNRLVTEREQSFSAPFNTSYDLVGRPLTVGYSAGTFTYGYDTAGRQTSTTRPDGKVIGYAYDADGNTTGITYPDNYSYGYAFDTLDRMSTVTETAPGGVAGGMGPKVLATYSYNPLSLVSTLAYGNGTTSTFAYDPYNGVQSITHAFAAGSTPPSVTYSYTRDQSERRVGDSVSVGGLWHPPAQGTDRYTANTLNQYAAINGASLSYDTNGNLTGDASAPLGTATYQFDQLNRLTAATNSQHAATYSYDPFSRRESKMVDSATTLFVYDGPRVLADYDASGAELQHYVYGAGNTPIAVEVFNGKLAYNLALYHYLDGLGSVVYLAGPAGQARAAYSYSPYGEAPSGNSTPYRFAGMRLDSETLLYYDNARYYSPKQGRFISPDPIGVKGGVNIYAYAGNDPLNDVDLTGLDDNGSIDAAASGDALSDGQAFHYYDLSNQSEATTHELQGGPNPEQITVYGQPYGSVSPILSYGVGGFGGGENIGGGGPQTETIVVVGKKKGPVVLAQAQLVVPAIRLASPWLARALGAIIGTIGGETINHMQGDRAKPPPGSKPISQTPWSGDHQDIKSGIGAGPADNTSIAPNGDVWSQNPDGSWTNYGPAGDYTSSGKPSGQRGKDRDQ